MATFGHYFHRIYRDDSRKTRLESGPDRRVVPPLNRDKVNRVLIYYGAFNPPHVGHLGALYHAFQNSPDLNIVAGIVCPVDVEQIERKNSRSNRMLVLSEEQRSELWERDARFPTWAFAPKNKYNTGQEFKEEIANAAKEDGYDILYLRLCGPDNWDFNRPRRHVYASCTEYLISDATRSASFINPDGIPQPVKGYTTWQRLELGLQPRVEQLQHTEPLLQTLDSPALVATAVGAVNAVEGDSSDSSLSNISEDSTSQSSSVSSTTLYDDSTPESSVEGQSPFSVARRR
jgi:hypothetical protein